MHDRTIVSGASNTFIIGSRLPWWRRIICSSMPGSFDSVQQSFGNPWVSVD